MKWSALHVTRDTTSHLSKGLVWPVTVALFRLIQTRLSVVRVDKGHTTLGPVSLPVFAVLQGLIPRSWEEYPVLLVLPVLLAPFRLR